MEANQEAHVPSEAERLLLILKHISTELRDAEKDQEEATRLDEKTYGDILEETRVAFGRALSTIKRLERFKTLGTKNRQLLEEARSSKEEIERFRHEAFTHFSRVVEEKITKLRADQKKALEELLALAEPDAKPE